MGQKPFHYDAHGTALDDNDFTGIAARLRSSLEAGRLSGLAVRAGSQGDGALTVTAGDGVLQGSEQVEAFGAQPCQRRRPGQAPTLLGPLKESALEEFGYVVGGAGTAGCVLAARLSEPGNCNAILWFLLSPFMPPRVNEEKNAAREYYSGDSPSSPWCGGFCYEIPCQTGHNDCGQGPEERRECGHWSLLKSKRVKRYGCCSHRARLYAGQLLEPQIRDQIGD
jgi:hypothetical protein